ncbi:dihydrolipoyl dehydrogenase [Anaerolineales bacterium HSG6]|nr:dihydrolipoyl dehydrogenase [Anaerolineales bacterium HSG6]MDM8532336.1 dihydrolipoyl dehydrogenase [Anaerolineales bacterium HSG25]
MGNYDTIVIGGGPGGYVSAIKASQLGQKTALIEAKHLGGICLNWGCIPTKSLLRNAEVINLLREGKKYGFSLENLTVDYSIAHKRSRKVSGRLTKGIAFLMKKNKIDVYEGYGTLTSSTQVEVNGETHTAKNIIIATGSRARTIPGVEVNGKTVLTYHETLQLTEAPKSMVVIGAGAIGMEFSYVFNSYGTDVTVVEMLPNVLPLEDIEVSKEIGKQFKRHKINVHADTRVEKIDDHGDSVTITISKGDKTETIQAEKVLVSIGVVPNSENLGLEAAGVATTEQGHIAVDDQMRTNVSNIYAVGDVTGKLALAHVGSAQGIIAAEAIAGRETSVLKYENMPRCTYTHPEVASVGLTETQAKEQGYEVKVGKYSFQANGKALGMGENAGFVKIVAEAKYNEILGMHMVGPHVTEMLAGPTGMINLESTLEELAHTVHPHPTLSEVIMEATHAALGEPIH